MSENYFKMSVRYSCSLKTAFHFPQFCRSPQSDTDVPLQSRVHFPIPDFVVSFFLRFLQKHFSVNDQRQNVSFQNPQRRFTEELERTAASFWKPAEQTSQTVQRSSPRKRKRVFYFELKSSSSPGGVWIWLWGFSTECVLETVTSVSFCLHLK